MVWRVCVCVCVSNIMMAEKNNTFPGLARFNALGARETIIKFKQGGDFIFPQTIYYIIHSRTRIQIYIIQKIRNRRNAVSRPRDLLSDEGENFLWNSFSLP